MQHEDDIRKLFLKEIRDKKRIGNNIFKRVSTRKGGSNMSSMRVPSQKKQKELSGKVLKFNMNDVLSYEEFQKRDINDQKLLMSYWRSTFATKEIMRRMNVDRNRFYKILDELDIPRILGKQRSHSKVEISEEELEKYLNDKSNYINYEKYKTLVNWQQEILLEEYLTRNKTISELTTVWKGSVVGSLYYIKSRMDKANNPKEDEEIKDTQKEVREEIPERVEEDSSEKTDTVSEKHETNIEATISKEAEENIFSFKLNGNYDGKSIIRRLNLLIAELEETEETLKVEITLESKR